MDEEPNTKDSDARKLEEFFVRHNANHWLRQYLNSRVGLHVWRAYAEYRRAGMPVPENILAKLDQWAAALGAAVTEKEVAAAIEMQAIGGNTAKRRMRAAEDNFRVIEHLQIREGELGQKPADAERAVAADLSLKVGNVQVKKSRWKKRMALALHRKGK